MKTFVKVFVAEIEIRDNSDTLKEGDVLNIPIIALTEEDAEKTLSDKFKTEGYPHYILYRFVEYSGVPHFDFGFLKQDNLTIK